MSSRPPSLFTTGTTTVVWPDVWFLGRLVLDGLDGGVVSLEVGEGGRPRKTLVRSITWLSRSGRDGGGGKGIMKVVKVNHSVG